jgi:hypothetical protein
MLLFLCRYLALVYAVGLAVGETVLNTALGQWHYAPMWVIDYAIVAYLVAGFWLTRHGRYLPILMSAFALSAGVMYIAFFLHFDPDLPEANRGTGLSASLIGLTLAVSVLGLAGTTAAWVFKERAGQTNDPKPGPG